MNLKEAQDAIEEILASIPDHALPEFDRVEFGNDGKPIVWWLSSGQHLGSATREGVRDPLVYRRGASLDAIHNEMTCRADQALLANGDNPEGVVFRAKKSKSSSDE